MKKYLIKEITPATVIKVFEVEAASEEEAMKFYLEEGEFECEQVNIDIDTDDNKVSFEVEEKWPFDWPCK